MKVETKSPLELTPRETDHWRALLESNPALDSPFFRPEFAQAVARVRDDVQVALIYDGERLVGFFPHQNFGRGVAKPLAGRLSDFQAFIVDSETVIDPAEVVRGCGLQAWDFDHLLAGRDSFQRFIQFTDLSPFIDLTEGYAHFENVRKFLGSQELKETKRKGRKLSREVGPLRLVPLSTDPSTIAQTFAWKSQQYERSEITDVFKFDWTKRLLESLVASPTERGFGGCLSALYAGDTLAAVHLGMRAGGVWHYWFPTYNPDLAAYSPGRVLLLELCRECESLGIERIDFGRGVSQFKRRMMTGVAQVGVGSVDLRPVSRALRAGWRQTRDWVRQSPLRGPAQTPAKALYRIREWLEFK